MNISRHRLKDLEKQFILHQIGSKQNIRYPDGEYLFPNAIQFEGSREVNCIDKPFRGNKQHYSALGNDLETAKISQDISNMKSQGTEEIVERTVESVIQ